MSHTKMRVSLAKWQIQKKAYENCTSTSYTVKESRKIVCHERHYCYNNPKN